MAPVLIVAGALLTVLAAHALGSLLASRLRLPLLKQERPGVNFILGSACLSLLVFMLCATHLYYRGVILALALGAILWSWRMRVKAVDHDPKAFLPFDKF